MSVSEALKFIQQIRVDTDLQARLLTFDDGSDLYRCVQLGAQLDLTFTVTELQAAYKHDWVMRWLLYHPSKVNSPLI